MGIKKAFGAVLLASLLLCGFTPKYDGGTSYTKSLAIWELYKTQIEIPSHSPYCYAPWVTYVNLEAYTTIGIKDNRNYLAIDGELYKTVKPIATANKKRATAILKAVKGKSKKAKVKYIYRWVGKSKYKAHIKTASDVLNHRTGDCAGQTAAFYVLCKTAKIPVKFCMGWVDGGFHAWNRVKVKGKWYYVDVTWHYYLSRDLWDDHKTIMEQF